MSQVRAFVRIRITRCRRRCRWRRPARHLTSAAIDPLTDTECIVAVAAMLIQLLVNSPMPLAMDRRLRAVDAERTHLLPPRERTAIRLGDGRIY